MDLDFLGRISQWKKKWGGWESKVIFQEVETIGSEK